MDSDDLRLCDAALGASASYSPPLAPAAHEADAAGAVAPSIRAPSTAVADARSIRAPYEPSFTEAATACVEIAASSAAPTPYPLDVCKRELAAVLAALEP